MQNKAQAVVILVKAETTVKELPSFPPTESVLEEWDGLPHLLMNTDFLAHTCTYFCSTALIKTFFCKPVRFLQINTKRHCWKETLLVTNTENTYWACSKLSLWHSNMGIISGIAATIEKRFNTVTRRAAEQQNAFVFDLSAAVSLILTSKQMWLMCCSVFLSTVEQRLPLHQQLSVPLLKFSLSLHLPLHVLPQSLQHKHVLYYIKNT